MKSIDGKYSNLNRLRKIILLLVAYFLPLAAVMYHCIINDFSADQLLRYRDQLRILAEAHWIFAIIMFLAVYFAIVLCSAPFTVIMNLFAGYLFGSIMGALLANSAVTGGSYILYKFSRYIVQKIRGDHRHLGLIKAGSSNTVLMLFFSRLSPFFPAPVINMASGALGVKPRLFVLTTFFGSFPLILMYTLIGKHLGTFSRVNAIYDQNLMIMLILLGLVSLSPLLKKDIRTMLVQRYRNSEFSEMQIPVRGLIKGLKCGFTS
jgi:uncharacterized membrane protein YdjX (TVP38/TMEM64 family)